MLEKFTDREAASAAAADIMENALRRRFAAATQATLAVSGGTTPARTFEHLATRDLPWPTSTLCPATNAACRPITRTATNACCAVR